MSDLATTNDITTRLDEMDRGWVLIGDELHYGVPLGLQMGESWPYGPEDSCASCRRRWPCPSFRDSVVENGGEG